jgi:hypothetical protein
MAEYIEREALLKEMLDFHSIPVYIGHVSDEDIMFENMVEFVKEQPTADVVPVVRCKDCKYYRVSYLECRNPHHNGIINCEGYCSYGERRCEDEQN